MSEVASATPPGVDSAATKKKSSKKKAANKPKVAVEKPDVETVKRSVTQADIDAAAERMVTEEHIGAAASKLMDRIPVTDNATVRMFGDAELTAEQALHVKRVKAGGAALCQIIINEVRNGEDRREAIRQVRAATMLAVSAIANGT